MSKSLNESQLFSLARDRVVVFDGGTGTFIQQNYDPNLDDYQNLEGCND